MDETCSVSFWKNNKKGGGETTYEKPQGQADITPDSDSIQVGDSAWVIVYNGKHFTGDFLELEPGTYKDDLNKLHRSSGGDWKNQIRSFIMYNAKPSFWGTSTDKPNIDHFVNHTTNQAIFTEDTNFESLCSIFPTNTTSANNSYTYWQSSPITFFEKYGMDGNINSLATGLNTWLIIFDDIHYTGNFLKVRPSTKYPDLNNIVRYDSSGNKKGDWKNQIQSFLIFAEEPEFWNSAFSRPEVNLTKFNSLFPNSYSDKSNAIAYKIEDSTYRIYNPNPSIYNDQNFSLQNTDGVTYRVNLDHENTFALDEHAQFDVNFNNSGVIQQISNFSWKAGGAFNISEAFIKIVDDTAWYLGTADALETLGVSEAAAGEFVETFDFICNTFNKISALIYKAEDNGGQFYFLPVIAHAVNRLCTSILANYNVNIYSSPNSAENYNLVLNNNGIPAAIYNELKTASGSQNWQVNQELTSGAMPPFNEVVEYKYQNSNYRTWYHETSISAEFGMFVSCKIDYERDNKKDDHITILLGFLSPVDVHGSPTLIFGQASVQFTSDEDQNIMTQPVTAGDIAEDIYNQIYSTVSTMTVDSTCEGRRYLADIAKANINAIVSSMRFEE